MAGLLVDDAAHVLERVGKIAGHARDHGVGVALRDHGAGEMIAVVIDEPLAIAEQIALALKPLEQELRIDGVARGEPRVVDFDLVAEFEAGVRGGLQHPVLAPDQNGAPQPLIDEGERGVDDLLLLALGEDDALGVAAHALEHRLHHPRDRIAPRRQLGAVAVHVDDGTAGHARNPSRRGRRPPAPPK